VERVSEIQALPAIPAHATVKTTFKLHEKGNTMTSPTLTQKVGQTMSVELTRDFIYPVDFTLPNAPRKEVLKAKADNKGAFPVTPTTPKEFTKQPTGVQITTTPRFEGGLIILKGEIKVTTVDGFTSAAGEVVARPIVASKEQPILLTANLLKAPLIRENRSPIFVAALPGKTYTMQVAGSDKPMLVDFTCELVPEGKH